MFKYLTSVILIGVSIMVLVLLAQPIYKDISDLKTTQVTYNNALDNSKSLEVARNKLTEEYNKITLDNLDRIRKLLPDNVDNIRLILEIEKIAFPYGMALKDVRYNSAPADSATDKAKTGGRSGGDTRSQKYGSWDLEFSVSTNYTNFLNFTKDLEKNLRIVDITSLQFDSAGSLNANRSAPDIYRFNYKIKTYWLKN
jgi:Tfp pilus assembly protein PilO